MRRKKIELTESDKKIAEFFRPYLIASAKVRYNSLTDEEKQKMNSDEKYRKKKMLWVWTGIVSKD